ncbi:MAG: Diaminopimelate decarboxylase [Phycisphaerae bacterium]|nr:Diaminopimelate decarboxylase [Phycisphaerae bacterium]
MYTWDELNSLLDSVGGAAFIGRLDIYRGNVQRFLGAFRGHYPNTNLGHSYKTNYLPALCVEADRLGLYAEVVSGMEYQIARTLGVPHERIIFNGPVKTRDELDVALSGGAMLNIDSLDELEVVADLLSGRAAPPAELGLRCNLDMQWQGKTSRFGLSASNGDLQEAARRIRQLPHARLAGLHCHSSFDRSAEAYADRAQAMVRIADDLFPEGRPGYLDLGGGFCGNMPPALLEQLSFDPPGFEQYAAAVAPILAARYGTQGGPQLILEPGVGMVADALQYACRVEVVKQLPGRRVAATAGSVSHLKIVPNAINLPMEVLRPPGRGGEEDAEATDVTGFTCLEHDVIFRDCRRPIARGDILVFSNVGAYSLVTAPPFIRTAPPVVVRERDGRWQTLMRKLSVEEFMGQFTWERGQAPCTEGVE